MSDQERMSLDRLRAVVRSAARSAPDPLPPVEVARLCRELAAREPVAQVLLARNSGRYGRLEVAHGLLDWSHSLRHEDPRRMLELARIAVRVARALPAGAAPPGLLSDLRAESWMMLGNALRVNNRLVLAEAALGGAEELLKEGSGDGLLLARLSSLCGSLRTSQRHFSAALELYHRAARLYQRLGDPHLAAEAYVAIGRVHQLRGSPRQALDWLHAGLGQIDVARDPRLGFVTAQVIAGVLNDSGYPEDAVGALRTAAPLFDLKPGDVALLRVEWLEARIWANQGRREDALDRLHAVRRAFLDRDLPYDAALAALDLATLYARR